MNPSDRRKREFIAALNKENVDPAIAEQGPVDPIQQIQIAMNQLLTQNAELSRGIQQVNHRVENIERLSVEPIGVKHDHPTVEIARNTVKNKPKSQLVGLLEIYDILEGPALDINEAKQALLRQMKRINEADILSYKVVESSEELERLIANGMDRDVAIEAMRARSSVQSFRGRGGRGARGRGRGATSSASTKQ